MRADFRLNDHCRILEKESSDVIGSCASIIKASILMTLGLLSQWGLSENGYGDLSRSDGGGKKRGGMEKKIRAATSSLMSSRDTARSLLMTSQITNCEMCRCFGEAGWGGQRKPHSDLDSSDQTHEIRLQGR